MERGHLEYLDVDGRTLLKWIFQGVRWGGGCLNWIDLVHDREMWRALVNAVMNFRVP
jgi:hypothetical protein